MLALDDIYFDYNMIKEIKAKWSFVHAPRYCYHILIEPLFKYKVLHIFKSTRVLNLVDVMILMIRLILTFVPNNPFYIHGRFTRKLLFQVRHYHLS